ncbi:hypothetical protein LMH87_003591 [Akanthomyces muscarius]|uniref:Polymer-forming cytoskeletal protein n=2 Tax=Akanthomyces TaxID=150366 RepID=A0A168HUD5_CORDF|nr:hypothetical protein LMH87_003591 [Akanthomyces muscarius]KAJ4144719.1 hypothetical protein LMH87_003591 [Akanthomyces muscarius]OAA78277.1 hypothetical protein LEL_05100 [Akanthomyces lecanii RCEF 1005]
MDFSKRKPASPRGQLYPQRAYPSPTSLPSPEVPQFQEFSRIPTLALDQAFSAWPEQQHKRREGMPEYYHHAGSSLTGDVYGLDYQRSRSIHSEQSLELTGPLDVAGSIKARNISFGGDFIVSDAIDAYGDIEINGNMTAEGRIKAFGDIKVNGSLTASGKIEGSSRLKLRGSIHAADVEIYGNVILRGYLYCRQLVVYGSIILVGPNSTYDVAGYEMVTGLRTRRDHEPDWDI